MKSKRGQTIAEYFILMSVFLAAVLATGFIVRMRGAFTTYFNAARDTIVPPGG